MDKEFIIKVLQGIKDEMYKITTGNLAHKKANIIWAVNTLLSEIESNKNNCNFSQKS